MVQHSRDMETSTSSRMSVARLSAMLKKILHMTLLHAVGNERGLRQVCIESNLSMLVFVLLDQHLWQMLGIAKSHQDKPHSCPVTKTKAFVGSTKVAHSPLFCS